jgi:beta-carotene 3-hydroxylase
MDKFDSVPYGLFLGPKVTQLIYHLIYDKILSCFDILQRFYWFILTDFGWQELEEVGGTEELEKEIQKRIKRRETLDAMQ